MMSLSQSLRPLKDKKRVIREAKWVGSGGGGLENKAFAVEMKENIEERKMVQVRM
jgi:hypothetical protein